VSITVQTEVRLLVRDIFFTSEQPIIQKTSLTVFSYTYINMISNILLHCDQKIQKENRMEIKKINIYYKIYIIKRKQKGKLIIN
jgi:hypothetical protein